MKCCIILFLFLCCAVYQAESQVLHSVSGDVAGGNYTYYSLMYKGPITLYLYSTSGDADVYVSQFINKPSYDPDNYCLQSSTCGLDVIYIPKSFNRPVGIGIYGHPFHDSSEYYLEVVYRQKDTYIFEEENDIFEEYIDPESEAEERSDSPEVCW